MLRKFVQQKLVLLTMLLAGGVCAFAQNTSNRGREFWVGYGHHQFMEPNGAPQNGMNMRLYLSTEAQPATVTVTIDSSGNPFITPPGIGSVWTRVYTIPPYTAIQTEIIPKGPVNIEATPGEGLSNPSWDARLFDLPPASGGTGGSGIFRNKGIHVVSNVPITAYAHIYGSASSGATMLLPSTAWGYEYVSLNSNQSYGSNCYSWAYVVAYKDNTVVEITPTVKTRAQNRTGLLPGVTTTVTLMKGQIYQLIGANLTSDVNGNEGTDAGGFSLSGTRFKSIASGTGECFPIAVFAGSSRTANVASCGSGGGDNDNQQLYPMHSWGKKYLIAPFSSSVAPATPQTSIVKVAFSVPPPATQLKRNGTVLPVPAGSLFYTFETSTADLIEADKPIMVNQFMTGGACMGGGVGDPEMVVVAPTEQAIKEVTFYRQSRQGITTNYLTLIVPTAGVASLRIDNSGVFDYTYPHPQNALMGKNYTVVVKRWTIGVNQGFQCYVKCDSAFNAITYGLGSVESYAYSAGAYINNLNALTGIHNQPDNSNGGQNIHQFTGVGTPIDLSIMLKYQPDRLTWKFSEMNPAPGACMTVTPALAGDFIMNPASAFYTGSTVINGTTYYKYKLPQTFTFNCAGTYDIPVEAYSPGINNCGSREMFYPSIEVKQRPVVDYSYLNATMCTKDTVYLTGPSSGLSGVQPFTMTQWKWILPGGVTSSHQDTAVVLLPGTHELKLVAITPDGLLSDTVKKTITIHPPPTTVLDAVPDVICIGQNMTFNQTISYAGSPGVPITNHYWDFGDGSPVLNNFNTSIVHLYTASNTYTAMAVVRVSDLCVSDTSKKVVLVSPEAKIAWTYPTTCLPSSGFAQFGAAATDLGGTAITNYTWNFGDPSSGANNTSNGQNPAHTFATQGTYTITLNVTTSTGCTGDTTRVLNFGVAPALSFLAFTPVCTSTTPFSIQTGSVTNGVNNGTAAYTGPGVNSTTNMFDPAVAGPGTHTITYTYTTPTCAETATQTITVQAPPAVSAGTYGPVCRDAAPVTLAGTPAGGIFTGTGVTGSTFNPATAGVGSHTITYSYTDANGCSNSTTTTIVVNALPTVNPGTYSPLCVNASAISLIGTPAGGTFSGPGVTGSSFNPVTAGVGVHTILYTYTDGNGCTSANSTPVRVNALPVVNAGTYAAVCLNATAVTLAGTPAGGTFSGPGVTGNTFNPATAGVGTHTITYAFTDANSCAASNTTTITVNALPVVDAGASSATCLAGAAITLAGTPAGGTFSGPGVTGTTFNPSTAGAGVHTITYSYTNANGCVATDNLTITVHALPTADAGTYAAVCVDGAAVTLAGLPAGGTFSGPGVTGNTFNPATAGVGTHNLLYNYTDASGCSASDNATITVNPLPAVNAGTYAAVCENATTVTLAGTPAGGTFSGPSVTGNTFNPGIAGTGTHTITYSYADANGCRSSNTATITVNALPVVSAGNFGPYCINGAAVTLAGTPAGGTFSGTGVTGGNTFNPATAGLGIHIITYNYTNVNGCSGTGTTGISVTPLPTVTAGTYAAVCVDATAVALAGTPAGGTFSGPGVTGNTFNPSVAGGGTHTITYNYTDANGCSNSATASITVNAIPAINPGTYPAVCVNAAAVTLAGTPTGGTFSGPGVTGNTFNPATAGAGTHTISYGGVAGCNNSTQTTTIVVNPLPTINPGTYAGICTNAAPVTLAGTPAGGTFSGPGVTGNAFNPATAGPGTHTIRYSYTDGNGCSNNQTTSITVHALPTPAAGVYAPVCIDVAPITLTGTPGGGTFSGPGVTGTTFNPAAAGAGTHLVTYNYTNANGCSAANGTSIVVNSLPVVTAGTYAPVCAELAPITLAGTPAGGTFSGPGVTGNTFNPGTAAVGNNSITYSFTSATGCQSSQSVNILVHPTPTSTFTLDNSICVNETTTLQSTGTGNITTYNWNLGDTRTPSYNNSNPFTVAYTTHDNYTISLTTISNMGCVSTPTTAQIGVHALPVINFGLPTGICMPEGNAVFTNSSSVPGNSALSYSWNFGDLSTPSTVPAPSHTYTVINDYTVTLTATSAFGCVASGSQTLESDDFFNKPNASFSVTPNELCQGEKNTFLSTSTDPAGLDIVKWRWDFGDNSAPATSSSSSHTYTRPGDYVINLVVTNTVGCVSEPFPQPVKVHLQPVIDAGKSFVVAEGTTIEFTAISNSQDFTFIWDPPLGLSDATKLKPTLIATEDQTYTLTAIGEFGCTAKDFITVKVLRPVKVPNVFTPNGDGIHDKWLLPNLADYPSCTVEVFNRYGQQVFYTAGYNKPWDGTFKGKDLPVGTYYYIIRLSNGYAPISGSVTIIR